MGCFSGIVNGHQTEISWNSCSLKVHKGLSVEYVPFLDLFPTEVLGSKLFQQVGDKEWLQETNAYAE